MKPGVRIILILLVIAGFALLAGRQDETRAQQVGDKVGGMKTYCIGRYLLDVPETFTMTRSDVSIGLPRAVRVVELGPLGAKTLPDHVAARIAQLRGGVTEDGASFRYADKAQLGDIQLIATKKYDPDLPTYESRSINVEAYFVRHDHLFRASVGPFASLDEVAQLDADPQQVGLAAIADATWPRDNETLPSRPGICADRALIDLPVVNDAASAGFTDPDAFGVGLSVTTSQQRGAQTDFRENPLSGLVGTDVEIAGIAGRETRSVSREDRMMMFEAHGIEGGAEGEQTRQVGLKLFKNDVELDAAPYPTAELDAIWRAVLASVKMR